MYGSGQPLSSSIQHSVGMQCTLSKCARWIEGGCRSAVVVVGKVQARQAVPTWWLVQWARCGPRRLHRVEPHARPSPACCCPSSPSSCTWRQRASAAYCCLLPACHPPSNCTLRLQAAAPVCTPLT